MKRILLFIFLGITSTFTVQAQQVSLCGTDQVNEELMKLRSSHPEEADFKAATASTPGVITIPVVIHILYKTAEQNLSDAVILEQVDILNETFRMQNSDIGNVRDYFTDRIGDGGFEFCLAEKDPEGNVSSGITRTETVNSYFFPGQMMSSASGGIDAWDTDQYLNIWVCNLVNNQGYGWTGYAVFPWAKTPTNDGIVVNYANFGVGSNSQQPYSLGRICTHEVGHYLGLYHTFQGGCGFADSDRCDAFGDKVCDTPPEIAALYACDMDYASCGDLTNDSIAMYENFMDYSPDVCRVMFTNGQAVRMNEQFYKFRSVLLESEGCANAGVSVAEKEALAASALLVYPNPASEQLNIKLNPEHLYNISVLDVLGKEIFVMNSVKQTNLVIDTQNWENGFYIVQCQGDGKALSEKIQIIH